MMRCTSQLTNLGSLFYNLRHSRSCSKLPDFTKDRYPVKRGNYGRVNTADIQQFEKILGSSYVLTSQTDVQSYNIDFCRSVRGISEVVLKPTTVQQISAVLRYCNEKKLAVCPQGGNTGLVGGSVPVFDEVVISLQNLNKIESIDKVSGILTCESGCVLQTLEETAKENDLCMPIDLGAKGSCHIGGNVSTNAGGLRLLRYGNLHGSVLGLEAVLANGEILNLMSNFKKDNTGYHLKHLFIGSEGTLGIVTKLAMHCPPASSSVHVAFVGLPSFEAVLNTFCTAKQYLAEILSSCEMIDSKSLKCCIEKYNLNSPIGDFPFYMLLETSGSNFQHDEEKFNNFLEKTMKTGDVLDGTITNEPSKISKIWQLREGIASSLLKDGYCFKYDISLPLNQFYGIVPATQERVGDLATIVCGYGHLGDSNLHLNVACHEYTQELNDALHPFVYEYTSKLRGSISAEHGIGFFKSKYLPLSKSQGAIDMMRNIKKMLDPNGILNPYKVITNN